MNAKDLKLLERVFAAEIDAALNNMPHVAQIKSKRMEVLEKEGYVVKESVTLGGGRFPVTVTGWALTEVGRLAYCLSCDDDDDKDLIVDKFNKEHTPPSGDVNL